MRMGLSIWGHIEAERTTEPPGSVWVRGLELQGEVRTRDGGGNHNWSSGI